MAYNVVLEQTAIDDLDKAVAYHIQFSLSKARRVENEMSKAVSTLEHNPYFMFRYDDVRCLPLGKKLPYMLHFTIYEATKTVFVFALFNTLQNPDKYPPSSSV